MYSDLHNHNHSRSYFWLKVKERKYRKKGMYNPWTIVASNMRSRRNAGMAGGYGQADLVKLHNGRVNLTFNALYPIEKGFFDSQAFKGKGTVQQRLIRFLTSKNLPLRDIMQMFIMKIPDRFIDYVQSNEYKYWPALLEEYDYLISKNNIRTRNSIIMPGFIRSTFERPARRRKKYPRLLNATGTYVIPKNKTELKGIINKPEIITMILTIEGAHAFGTDHGNVNDWIKNVAFMKKNWAFPVFFVTFSHHFDNKLCGHAHSVPDIGQYFLNQSKNLNKGFSKDGWTVLRKLLSITKDNKDNQNKDGYRILIDVKHMSAKGRLEYYEEVIKPCKANGINIPVIASHVGHSGRDRLQELIDNYENEKDNSFEPTGYLNNWNINICNEDVEIILETGGLIGLSLDQRIMGVPGKQKKAGGRNSIIAIWNNLKAILDAVYKNPKYTDAQKAKIWDCITIGSDNEGFIDPINEFKSALEFGEMRDQLYQIIKDKDLNKYGLNNEGRVNQCVDKVMVGNSKEFLKNHYPG